jgi:hypothetical protein
MWIANPQLFGRGLQIPTNESTILVYACKSRPTNPTSEDEIPINFLHNLREVVYLKTILISVLLTLSRFYN